MSAYTLLQQSEASSSINKNRGLHLIISAMDAFLEGGDEEEDAGFTDSQIQSLLSVCNTVVEHPLLLFMAGPVYHMVTNAAILLCHLLNAMHARLCQDSQHGEVETALFGEVLDTLTSVRKLLQNHRKKIPVKLRCHGIPRPNLTPYSRSEPKASVPFIDLGETLMCASRSCQGFVLLSCSPCVAAERARASTMRQKNETKKKGEGSNENFKEFDKELQELGIEFDMDDDALLVVLSRIIST
uniref:Uncharacterized protein n=1 Tax=Eucampia antarctica TaxID=49252 RepID=A0A7S2RZY2_9STRA